MTRASSLHESPPAGRDVETLSTRAWIDAAKAILIRDGIEAVKIDRIAKECGVTRGGFYWRFRNRADLLDALLSDWQDTNTQPLIDALEGPGAPHERFEAAAILWIEERRFDPRFDTAVRNWATNAPDVAAVVHAVDQRRIDAFRGVFLDAGLAPNEALVRARVTYFHQIGYYALGLQETQGERRALSRLYYQVLTGFAAFDAPEERQPRARAPAGS